MISKPIMAIMMLMMLRIIANIHAQDFIVYNPQPTINPSSPVMRRTAPRINKIISAGVSIANMTMPIPVNKPRTPPRSCSIARIVTPSGLSPEGAEYPVVGVGISAIFLPFQTFTSNFPTEFLSNIVPAARRVTELLNKFIMFQIENYPSNSCLISD